MKITHEMIGPCGRNLYQEFYDQQVKALDQDEWCMIYTGRSWHGDLALEFLRHAALMCDATEITFGDYPLLAPVGACDHPYDISKPCALKTWEHAKFVENEEDIDG